MMQTTFKANKINKTLAVAGSKYIKSLSIYLFQSVKIIHSFRPALGFEVALGLSTRISAVSKPRAISTCQKRNQVHPKDLSQKLSTTLRGALIKQDGKLEQFKTRQLGS